LPTDDIDYGKDNPQFGGNDIEAVITQTQRRVWKALKRLHDYDSSFEAGREYLLNHSISKVRLIIMYVNLGGLYKYEHDIACRQTRYHNTSVFKRGNHCYSQPRWVCIKVLVTRLLHFSLQAQIGSLVARIQLNTGELS
jgi:hypothetical protein